MKLVQDQGLPFLFGGGKLAPTNHNQCGCHYTKPNKKSRKKPEKAINLSQDLLKLLLNNSATPSLRRWLKRWPRKKDPRQALKLRAAECELRIIFEEKSMLLWKSVENSIQ